MNLYELVDEARDLPAAVWTDLQDHQRPPVPFGKGWVLLAGRGAGKSYAGMHWLNDRCLEKPGLRARIIAPTFGDGVASCVEGPNGLLVTSGHRAVWKPSQPGGAVVEYPNRSRVWVIGTHSPKDVDRLRALTNIEIDVFEEAFANQQLQAAWDQAALSRRRGEPRFVVTSTPRPHPLIKDWTADPKISMTRAIMSDNKFLGQDFIDDMERIYKGTRLYRQEVLGEVLEDVEGALFRQVDLDRSRVLREDVSDRIRRVVVGVDPASGTGTTGIVVVGQDEVGHLYILEDLSVEDGTPAMWASAAVRAARTYDALIVVEINQGGKMATEVLKQADPSVSVSTVYASAGKKSRAEPMALMFEADEQTIHLAGAERDSLVLFEDQCISWTEDSKDSPDRMDAAAHAVNRLRRHKPGTSRVARTRGTLPGW